MPDFSEPAVVATPFFDPSPVLAREAIREAERTERIAEVARLVEWLRANQAFAGRLTHLENLPSDAFNGLMHIGMHTEQIIDDVLALGSHGLDSPLTQDEIEPERYEHEADLSGSAGTSD